MLDRIGRQFVEHQCHRDEGVFGEQEIGSRPANARKGGLDLAQQRVHRPGHEIGAEQHILRAVERVEAAADPLDIIVDILRGVTRQRDDRAGCFGRESGRGRGVLP